MKTNKNHKYFILELTRLNYNADEIIIDKFNLIQKNELNNAGFIIFDTITNTQCWSQLFYSSLGYENNEIHPSLENLESLMHPSDFEIIKEITNGINAIISQDLTIKIRFKAKSGTYIIFNSCIRPILDNQMEHYYS